MPFNEFTTVDLGCERGNYAYNFTQRLSFPMSKSYIDLFEQLWNDKQHFQDVTDQVIENITTVYNENAPEFIYFVTLYNIFSEFLDDVSEDTLPNEANKKIIIFTAFADTAMYLYDHVSDFMLKKFGLHTAVITGSVDGRTTAKLKNADMNTILTCFSPRSKDRDLFDNIPKVDIQYAGA